MWVPSPLDEKPDDYVNFEHHVNSVMQKKKKQSKRIVENFVSFSLIICHIYIFFFLYIYKFLKHVHNMYMFLNSFI